jgi:two-component system, NtrC family, response regulator AlgB
MRILLIDDDAGLRKSVSLALTALGHGVSEASNGPEALAVAVQTPFDLALLDLRLADQSGLDLLPELLQLVPDLQVVVITAYATIESAVEAMRRGAFDYLPKPFTPDQLRGVVDQAARLRGIETALQEQVRSAVPETETSAGPNFEVGSRTTLEQLEAEHIRRVLLSTTTIEEAAEVLGIDPSTLYRKRKRYGL